LAPCTCARSPYGVPSQTWPGLLDDLNRLAFPYRWTTRAICLDKTDASRLLGKIRRQWFASASRFMAIPHAKCRRHGLGADATQSDLRPTHRPLKMYLKEFPIIVRTTAVAVLLLALRASTAFADSTAYTPIVTGFSLPNAQQAVSATSAQTANYATTRGFDAYATNAGTATTATNAGYATSAGSANTASSADSATYATNAGTATTATSAGYATSAGSAKHGEQRGFGNLRDERGHRVPGSRTYRRQTTAGRYRAQRDQGRSGMRELGHLDHRTLDGSQITGQYHQCRGREGQRKHRRRRQPHVDRLRQWEWRPL